MKEIQVLGQKFMRRIPYNYLTPIQKLVSRWFKIVPKEYFFYDFQLVVTEEDNKHLFAGDILRTDIGVDLVISSSFENIIFVCTLPPSECQVHNIGKSFVVVSSSFREDGEGWHDRVSVKA